MAPIIKILRGHTAPPVLEAGRIAIDQTNKNLYVGIDDGNGGTINEIVGGSGTFATKQFVTDAVSAGTGSLGTMSTQNADSVAITGGAIDGAAIGATTTSTGKFTSLIAESLEVGDGSGTYVTITNNGDMELIGGMISGLRSPALGTDVVNKDYVDFKISALGSVFTFIGDVSIGGMPFDLNALPTTQVGSYYRVDVAGTYTYENQGVTESFVAKVGDAFVKTESSWMKLDNVDVEVLGTANEIVVTGDENAGYTVAIATEFKDRVSDVESKTQNIDFAGTVAGTTVLTGALEVGGAVEVTGNLVGTGTNAITDFIIDGGEY